MALSKIQKGLVGGLNLCGMKVDDIQAIVTLLKTEDQQWEMLDYLEKIIDSPPSRPEIFQRAVQIADL